jgi:hypothetical protein
MRLKRRDVGNPFVNGKDPKCSDAYSQFEFGNCLTPGVKYG